MKGKYNNSKTKDKNYQQNEEERKKQDSEHKKKIEGVKKGKDKLAIPLEMSDEGKYPVSIIRNISTFNYQHDKSKRAGNVFNKFPPGNYELKQLLGKIFDNKYKTYKYFLWVLEIMLKTQDIIILVLALILYLVNLEYIKIKMLIISLRKCLFRTQNKI